MISRKCENIFAQNFPRSFSTQYVVSLLNFCYIQLVFGEVVRSNLVFDSR